VSRIGKLPVPLVGGVKCEVSGSHVKVTGPKGALETDFDPDMKIEASESEIVVSRPSENKEHRALHGLTRALLNNMVIGVSQGYEKTLLIEGVGYRASIQGKILNLTLGFSHPVSVEPPEGITFTVEGTQTIKVSGINKQMVGQMAANVRAYRKPEPYKGKGIRYADEHIRRKVSKAAATV
jgi:large subunit ribosomal protein L6